MNTLIVFGCLATVALCLWILSRIKVGYIVRRFEIVDISIVSHPSNPDALFDKNRIEELSKEKS